MEIKPSVTKYLLFTKSKLCLYLFQRTEVHQHLHVSQRGEGNSGQRNIRGSMSYKTNTVTLRRKINGVLSSKYTVNLHLFFSHKDTYVYFDWRHNSAHS